MGAVFGHIGEETPKYEDIEKKPDYEIRQYGPVIVAETTFQGRRGESKGSGDAFWALAGYIGVTSAPKNIKPGSAADGSQGGSEAIAMTAPVIMQEAGEKIAMTAPVIMEETSESGAKQPSMTMQFVLPSKFTMETVPKPTDPRVTVKEVPGKKVGVHVYTGRWTEEQVKEKAQQLRSALEAAGHVVKGTYSTAFYNSPFTIPWCRRNDVWFELEK